MAHPNEELVRRAFDAFAKGDVDTLRELTDPDAVWHNPGRNQLSGDHRGVDAILRFFAKTAELTGGTFRADLHDVVANDDHAVAIYVARAEREGRTFETRSVLVQHIRNGKLVETWLLEDRGATRCGVGLPRFDGQGWWLGQAACVRASRSGVASNSLGVW
jgi:ketosteroid isomerase-like protein